jgi:hypothetical protein
VEDVEENFVSGQEGRQGQRGQALNQGHDGQEKYYNISEFFFQNRYSFWIGCLAWILGILKKRSKTVKKN